MARISSLHFTMNFDRTHEPLRSLIRALTPNQNSLGDLWTNRCFGSKTGSSALFQAADPKSICTKIQIKVGRIEKKETTD